MRAFSIFLTGLIFAVPTSSAFAQQSVQARGAALLGPFKAELKQALVEGLAKGPSEAVSSCQLQAPKIAAKLSREGVRVGRTSERLRNPANVSPDWVLPILKAYGADPLQRAPRAVHLSDGRVGYVEPIVAQALCLTCHGKSVAGDLAAEITKLYPEDKAVGYQEGDLRGAFWVEFPAVE